MVRKICEYCGKPFYSKGHNAQKMHKKCARLKHKEDNARRLRHQRHIFKVWLESCEIDRIHNQTPPEMGFMQNDYDMYNHWLGGNTKYLQSPTFGYTKEGKPKPNRFSNLPKEREKQIREIHSKIKKEKNFIFCSGQQHNTNYMSAYYSRYEDNFGVSYDGF
ncbi:MAG: hypothetical protein MR750_03155 [Methanobrevibacter boviskoreani]|uniref:hypothetical protein n=1 Tax=Methanobrevibacter boviskoreani TaxID=1348249 RepID=UPI0023A821D9|nr:hypothetical protein [Methanobrevibacter boviskoreani]MCI6930239.1 hypothetical protein [Methanobrevibacter boviskoreani]MDY5614616.1 hypothetical protein [Methanobrevibacter boviskoreani]